jgi:thiol-disulfide isomerase/thioredoxin
MAKAHRGAGVMWLAGCLLLGGGTAPAWAQPEKVAKILNYKPRQDGVDYSTPAAEEQKDCEVKVFAGSRPGSSGFLLLDAAKRPLRRFFDSNGDRKIDVWSYYKDGVEVYREVDTSVPNNDKPDQYRWLNAGGTKWGFDLNEDGKIDFWKTISSAEVAQEVFAALAGRDFARLRALFLSEAELRALKLPAVEVNRLRKQLEQAPAKFQATLAKLPGLSAAHFVRLEAATPYCVPAEALGTDQDVYRHPSRTILYENAEKKHDWLQTGEMIQIGPATWRLVDAPAPGDMPPPPVTVDATGNVTPATAATTDPEMQKLMEKLAEHDSPKNTPPPTAAPAELLKYNMARVQLIEAILNKCKADERETWLKQLADNLSTAAQNSPEKDKAAYTRLGQLKDQVAKSLPGSNLAGYVTFRHLWAEYGPQLAGQPGPKLAEVQASWMGELAKFVQTYPGAEDTPDALIQLGMGCEFGGKEKEAEAKRYYQQLATSFPNHPLAAKAKGAVRRLELEGQVLELAGPKLAGGGTFDMAQVRGKVVVVYYWASTIETCVGDFARFKQLQAAHGSKGLELVCVNLDDKAEDATKYLQTTPVQGTHLYQPGEAGGSNPLATQYGIMGLPTLFLVGRDGKVLSRSLQVHELEDAIKKAI